MGQLVLNAVTENVSAISAIHMEVPYNANSKKCYIMLSSNFE